MRWLGVRVPSPAQPISGSGAPREGPAPRCGGVPERSKGTDCKSVGLSAYGGSKPPPSTIISLFVWQLCGNSSVARASAFQAEGRGFESRFPLHLEPTRVAL